MNLSVENLGVTYQNVSAITGVSLDVPSGAFVTLIGSNGAGKSTTLRAISGLVKSVTGEIQLDGKSILGLDAHEILQLGIAHVPEGRRVFKDLSVIENLYLGAYTSDDRKQVEDELASVFERFPRLEERKAQQARTLSGGEQQMLAIGRALMSRPKILLLDEPSLGLAPIIVQDIGNILTEINGQGVSVILVEQNADLALQLAQRAFVLETGSITMEGEASELADNEHVRKAYLGV